MEFTIVSGLGLWNSWTRNYKTPLLACLELLDNCFDATLKQSSKPSTGSTSSSHAKGNAFQGKIHLIEISRNDSEVTSKEENTDKKNKNNEEDHNDKTPLSCSSNKTSSPSTSAPALASTLPSESVTSLLEKNTSTASSGIRILNNSSKPIKPLVEILEVYCYEKGEKHNKRISYNGVGLKQGCATLSDLSFVITKNHTLKRLEFGIISVTLQRESGVRLPAYQFHYKHDTTEDFIMNQISKLTQNDAEVIQCIQKFGKGSTHDGLKQLSRHFIDLLSHDEWGNHAFCVLLSDLRHGEASKLLDEIREHIPRYYIHIPSNFELKVHSTTIQFSYWQKRLVEFSFFQVRIDPKTAWDQHGKKDHLWKNPPDGYTLNIYCGFNPVLNDNALYSSCALYVYSRRFGRLIKYLPDARAYLGLNAGGSDFSQGMTVIVDDMNGNLPLSPSKQDIAFGGETYGNAHKINFLSLTSACAFLYWTHNVGKVKNCKTDLTFQISRFQDEVLATIRSTSKDDRLMLPLSELNLTKFHDFVWRKLVTQGMNRIRVDKYKFTPYVVTPGVDTKFLLHCMVSPGKKRGRPFKKICPKNIILQPTTPENQSSIITPLNPTISVRKRRGRPPKEKNQNMNPLPTPLPKRRGRPPKQQSTKTTPSINESFHRSMYCTEKLGDSNNEDSYDHKVFTFNNPDHFTSKPKSTYIHTRKQMDNSGADEERNHKKRKAIPDYVESIHKDPYNVLERNGGGRGKNHKNHEATDITFISEDAEEWFKNAKTKTHSSRHVFSPDLESFSSPQLSFRMKKELQARKIYLERQIEKEKRDNSLEQQALREVHARNQKDIENLQRKVIAMEKMMKAMIEAVS